MATVGFKGLTIKTDWSTAGGMVKWWGWRWVLCWRSGD